MRLGGLKRSGARRPNVKGERGFTLIETAAALLILMIAGLGVVSLFTYGIRNNAGMKDRELALAVAQKRMEWIRGIPFNPTTRALAYSFPNSTGSAAGGLGATAATGVSETITSGGRTYTVVTIISNDGGVTDANSTSKTITITVRPLGSAAVVGAVTLVTRRTTLALGAN
jgi:Tfp pilus assembly protein PilV